MVVDMTMDQRKSLMQSELEYVENQIKTCANPLEMNNLKGRRDYISRKLSELNKCS